MITLNGVLTITLVVVLAVLGVALTANKGLKWHSEQLKSINKELRDSVTTYKNKYGEEVSKKTAAEASLKLLQESYADNFDWIKQHMGIQAKNVRGIFKAVTETTIAGEGTIDTVVVDTSGGISKIGIGDHSPWHDFTATIKLNPYSVAYTFETRDSITLVPYKEGRNLYVKGVSANPHSKITGLQGILVSTTPRKKSWGIGPSIQIGYDTQIRITPGISLQYSLIKF